MTSPDRWLTSCLMLAAACAATGGLAALTAAPPAVDFAVWPPAGIALAALAARGRHLWPGVWLGTFAVAVPTAVRFVPDGGPAAAALAAALIATAYAAQAAAGAWLARRAAGDPLRLIRTREILSFLAVAGPVHTVPAAAASAAVVCGHGVHPWAAFGTVWVEWWWSDVVGGLVFAPIALTLIGTPRDLWRPRVRTVAAPLGVVGVLAAGLFLAAREWDATGPRERLQAEADRAADVLRADLDRLQQGMDDVRRGNDLPAALRTAAGRVRVRSDLQLLRATCPTARGLVVYEAVPGDRRAEVEAAYRRVDSRLADFHVSEWVAGGGRAPAADRDRYLVAVQANPVPGNFAALGLDLFSVPGVRAAFDRAVDEGRPVAVLPGGSDPALCPADAILVVRPFYGHRRSDDPAGRRAEVRGALVAVFDRAAVPGILAAGRDPRVGFTLADGDDSPAPAAAPGGAVAIVRVELAGLPVGLHAAAGPAFMAAHRTRYAAAAGAVAVAVGVLAAGWLLVLSGRTAVVDEEVARRTAELARTEAALRTSEARLAEAQRIAAVGSWEWDVPTGEVWWSDQMYRLLGHEPGAVPPTLDALLAAVHPDDRPLVRRNMAAAEAGAAYEYDFRVVRPDGAGRVLHVEAVIERDAAGRAVRWRGTNQDVTDRTRAEAERRRFDERLQQTQKLEGLGVLAGGVAHDFNNLLTGILGYASLAREAVPAESDLHDYLRPVESAATHAAALCQQMLAYAGKGVTVRGPFRLNRVIADTAELLRLSASKKVELRFAPADDVPVLDGDASQVRQVVLNLVTNAAEAIGDAPGVIEVSTGCGPADGGELPAGLYAWVQVRDTGCGMTPEVVRKIFDPFFTTKFTGRGLGLSAVHGIARSHGGAVTVASTPGAGTTFRVYLAVPAADPTVRTPPPAVHTPARIDHPARRAPAAGPGAAVVADDDPAVRLLAAATLAGLGFEVRAAENGAEAVELVRAGGDAVRVAVLDVLMPVLDGKEAVAAIRGLRPGLPVVVMSGYSEPDVAGQFRGDGVAGFVQKPFRPADLAACVRRAVARAERFTPAGRWGPAVIGSRGLGVRGQPLVERGDRGVALTRSSGGGFDLEFHSARPVGVDPFDLFFGPKPGRFVQLWVTVIRDTAGDGGNLLGNSGEVSQ